MLSIPDNKIRANMIMLPNCNLIKEDGSILPLHSLWKERTAILVFLRHFACDACRKHAVEVWNNREVYRAKGAEIHFIGNGPAQFIKTFKEDHKLQGASFYTDPSLKSFHAAGFKKGFWISPGAMHSRPEFLRLALNYQLKGSSHGNVWQLGGVLVVKPDGTVPYQFTSQAMGDFAPTTDAAVIANATV